MTRNIIEKSLTLIFVLSLLLSSVSCSKSPKCETPPTPIEPSFEAPEIAINIGDYWIAVADRNVGAKQNGVVGWFMWHWSEDNPNDFVGNIDWKGDWIKWVDAKSACENYIGVNESRGWRLPTKAELAAIAGKNGELHNINNDRKIKFEEYNTWKLYDEQAGKEHMYVYFQIGGSTTDWLDYYNNGGYYWTSDIDENIDNRAWYLVLETDGISEIFSGSKSDLGLSVRCVKNIPLT